MSWPVVRDVIANEQWLFRERDGAVAFRVLLCMAVIARDDNPPLYYGGRKQLADMVGINEIKVSRGIAVLEKHGLIVRVGPGTVNDHGKRRRTHVFEVRVGHR